MSSNPTAELFFFLPHLDERIISFIYLLDSIIYSVWKFLLKVRQCLSYILNLLAKLSVLIIIIILIYYRFITFGCCVDGCYEEVYKDVLFYHS